MMSEQPSGLYNQNLLAITERLYTLEAKTECIGTIEHTLLATQESISGISNANDTLRLCMDDREYRSRRNNLVFHGLVDSKDKWSETEEKVMAALMQYIDPSLPTDIIERAHRLSGNYQAGWCRPVIVQFISFRTKQSMLVQRAILKGTNISVVEDFCFATTNVRKKLTEFAKCLPHSPTFKLLYDKLHVNNATYIYDALNDEVQHIKRRGPSSQNVVLKYKNTSNATGPATNTRARANKQALRENGHPPDE